MKRVQFILLSLIFIINLSACSSFGKKNRNDLDVAIDLSSSLSKTKIKINDHYPIPSTVSRKEIIESTKLDQNGADLTLPPRI